MPFTGGFLGSLGDIAITLGLDFSSLSSGLDAATAAVRRSADAMADSLGKLNQVITENSDNMLMYGSAAMKLGGVLSTVSAGLFEVGESSLKAAGNMEQAQVAFTNLLGSGEKAKTFLAGLVDFAIRTPFTIPGLVDATRRLMAMGFAAQQVMPMIKTLGDTAAGLGLGDQGIKRLTLAFGEMQARGTVAMREMNMLAYTGFGAMEALAKKLDMTHKELMGKIHDREIESAQGIPLLLEAMNEKFGGQMDAQAKTLLGTWSNIHDAITKTFIEIGNAMMPAAKSMEQAIYAILNVVQDLAHGFAGLPVPIQDTILVVAGLTAAIGPVILTLGALSYGIGISIQAIATLTPLFAPLITVITDAGIAIAAFATTAIPSAISGLSILGTTVIEFTTFMIPAMIKSLYEMIAVVGTTLVQVTIPAVIRAIQLFATTVTTGLIPAIVEFTTVTIPAAISAVIAFATTAIPAAIAGITELAVASIPLLVGVLTVLAGVIAAVAVAWGAWKLGEWLYQNIPLVKQFGDEIANLIGMLPILGKYATGQDTMDASTKQLAASTQKLSNFLQAHGVIVERGTKTVEQWAAAVSKAGRDYDQTAAANAAATAGLTAAQKEALRQVEANRDAQAHHTMELEKAKAVLAATRVLYQQHKATLEDVRIAEQKVTDIIGVATKVKKEHSSVIKTMSGEEANWTIKIAAAHEKIDQAQRDMTVWNQKITQGIGPMWDLANALYGVEISLTKLSPGMKNMISVLDQVGEAMGNSKKQADALGDAMERQDIKSSTALHKTAIQAQKDYETIRNSGVATTGEINEALISAIKAQIEYQKSIGQSTKELEKQLKKIEDYSKSVVTAWDKLAHSLKRLGGEIVTSLSSILVGSLWSNKQNIELDKQTADLEASLAKRTADWEQYQIDATAELDKIRKKNADDLAAEEADLNKSLANKKADYDQFVLDTNQKLNDLKSETDSKRDQEIKDLRDSLADKEAAYNEYEASVYANIEELKQKNAEDLANDLADLQNQLADKTQSYEDYVTDVNTKLSRIHEDTVDNIADKQRNTTREITDKQTAYNRDEQDTLTRIERLKKAGKKDSDEQIVDLRTELARKKQDLDEYIRRANEDLADYTQEQKKREQQETADAQTELDRRTRDFNEFIKDNKQKVIDVTNKHKIELEKQTSDLLDELAKRAQALEDDRESTAAKIAEVTQKYNEEYNKQRADLLSALAQRKADLDAYNADIETKRKEIEAKYAQDLTDRETALKASFDKEKADYDQFKADIKVKLDEIKSQHVTVWTEIRDLIIGPGGILAAIAKGFADVLIEEIGKKIFVTFIKDHIGALLGALQKVLDKIPLIGDAFEKIFGGGAGTVGGTLGEIPPGVDAGIPGIPGVPGTGGGGGDAAGSGGPLGSLGGDLMGWIGLGAGVVSAVSSVIGIFQNAHQETSLNAIEHNTRYSMMYLGERADGGILGILFKIDEEIAWGANTKATEALKDAFVGWAGSAIADLDDIKSSLWKVTGNIGTMSPSAGGGGEPSGGYLSSVLISNTDDMKAALWVIRDAITAGGTLLQPVQESLAMQSVIRDWVAKVDQSVEMVGTTVVRAISAEHPESTIPASTASRGGNTININNPTILDRRTMDQMGYQIARNLR